MIDPDAIPALTTDWLLLRRSSPSDADGIVALADNWEVARWLARLPFPYRRQDALVFLDTIVAREAAWIIERRGDRCFMGVVGLAPGETMATAELGYWLGEPFWHRGYASEAAGAALAYAFHGAGLSGITSGCFVDNARSARVLEKLGFRRLGLSARFCVARARELPHLDMWLTREEWTSRGGSGSMPPRP